MREIQPDELDEMIENHDAPLIVDVRALDEFNRAHIPGARHIPADSLGTAAGARLADLSDRAAKRTVVVYSNHGARSADAVRLLDRQGTENICSLAGGIERWRKLGMAVVGD